MPITAKRQVTSGTYVVFEVDEGSMTKVKPTADGAQRTRGQKLVESLRGRGDFQMTTDDVVALMRGPTADNERKLGALAGLGRVPSDFDAPLPSAVLDAFEGRSPKD